MVLFSGCSGSGSEAAYILGLSWDEVSLDEEGGPETVVGYNVYVSEDSGDFYLLGAVASPDVEIEDLNSGSNYEFYVTAYDMGGNESASSEIISVSIP